MDHTHSLSILCGLGMGLKGRNFLCPPYLQEAPSRRLAKRSEFSAQTLIKPFSVCVHRLGAS